MNFSRRSLLTLSLVLIFLPNLADAQITLPAIFSDGMVLQRDIPVRIWGKTKPITFVDLTLGDKSYRVQSDVDGDWTVLTQPMPASKSPITMTIKSNDETIQRTDILVGEVWVCSGQSNMKWMVRNAVDGDLATLSSHNDMIRLITVPNRASQQTEFDFEGRWEHAGPGSVPDFSAVGYFFGKKLYETIDVPIGLINNAWGGSAAEAWVTIDELASNPQTAPLLPDWEERVSKSQAQLEKLNSEPNSDAKKKEIANIEKVLQGQQRPANLYNGCLHPIIGYSMRGVIWYQGEANAGRAEQYRTLFPMLITQWRNLWGQGDFPFYWVQLADFRDEVDQPAPSDWAELRQAQTLSQQLPNTGQAVIIDLGTGSDIHPRNKEDVASRLLRLALKNDYGIDIQAKSPEFSSAEVKGNKILITFNHVAAGLKTLDSKELIGFTIAGEDQKFYHATAKIVGKNQVEVSSPDVTKPLAVRYAWADNPICNLYSSADLPATPFRTDDWPGITDGKRGLK